ncbi:MAG TPA: LLM class flavin-dependent oxidoreductase [Solirubrobacteraceae bacterium]|nr:LLM class flavin-dependent oxidoreductase [Solirubrobacteraceae bacterium]
MRFGIFYEHQLPRPWDEGAEHRLLTDALDQVELADRLGFDSVWAVEHHFLEEYSHSSASDVFLAAASQRTRSIRLGFGILPTPPAYQHPARIAETVATLDLVSGGRVELGTGETSSGAELAGFGVERATKREQWAEGLDAVTRMMVEEPFAGIDGRYVTMPPRNVVPKPLQKPHPPLWVACSRRETIRLAAERGIGALSFSFVEPEEARGWVDEYYAIVGSERCVPAGFAVNPNVAVALPMMVHRDEAQAIERGIDGAHFFGYSLTHWYVFGRHRPGRTSIWDEFQQRRAEVGFAREIVTADQAPLGVKILQQGLGSLRGAVGTPEQVRDLIRRYEEAGVDQMLFVLQAGRNRHEHVCEALELFAAEVMPEFAGRRAERDAAKRERLAGAAEAALARREAPRESDPDYVIGPTDSGPPAGTVGKGAADGRRGAGPQAGRRSASRRDELADALALRADEAFAGFVARSSDARLERTVGSGLGLRVLFTGMAQRFAPEKADGFAGELQYELRTASGRVKRWVVAVDGSRARARPGAARDPRVTIRAALADFARIAGRDLDPGEALLTGRLELAGDLAIAPRLGEMFGQDPAL